MSTSAAISTTAKPTQPTRNLRKCASCVCSMFTYMTKIGAGDTNFTRKKGLLPRISDFNLTTLGPAFEITMRHHVTNTYRYALTRRGQAAHTPVVILYRALAADYGRLLWPTLDLHMPPWHDRSNPGPVGVIGATSLKTNAS